MRSEDERNRTECESDGLTVAFLFYYKPCYPYLRHRTLFDIIQDSNQKEVIMNERNINPSAVLVRRITEVFDNYEAEIKREQGEYQMKMGIFSIFEFGVLVFVGLLLWNSIVPILELNAVMVISCIGLVITIGMVAVMIRFTKQHKIFKKRCEAMLCVIINEIFKEYYDNLWNALGTVHYDDGGDVPSEKSET